MQPSTMLGPGDPAPLFYQRSFANPRFAFDTVAGRYIVLCFFGSAADDHAAAAVQAAKDHPFFDDVKGSFFGVTTDPEDAAQKRIADRYPGHRFFLDFDGAVTRAYGVVPKDHKGPVVLNEMKRSWVVLDPTLRVLQVFPFTEDRADIDRVLHYLEELPPPALFAGPELRAPIAFLPNVFEPEFCDALVTLYKAHGGQESGFMRDVGGKTVGLYDHSHKSRKDYNIDDQTLIAATQARIRRRVVPEIKKVFQFGVTRMERYIVACYTATDGGHFRSHRDNTTLGTAHRRFAVSINLNDDFEGGALSFPEYGTHSFVPPKGGAVIFSCSLLHTVSKVTKGDRYAFLPFLYDDAAAAIRDRNREFLAEKAADEREEAAKAAG